MKRSVVIAIVAASIIGGVVAALGAWGLTRASTVEAAPKPTVAHGASVPSKSPESRVITFGVTLDDESDLAKLDGASEEFKQFMAGLLQTDCFDGTAPTVVVRRYMAEGFALGLGGCTPRPTTIWARKGGVWQVAWSGTGLWACHELRAEKIPPQLLGAGGTCVDVAAGTTVAYAG